MMEFDPVEAEDLNRLAIQVFRQSLEDYIHLQHPLTRSKKYVHEAFLSSIDMFWDPDYRLDLFLDDDSEPMTLEEFLKLASDRSNLDLEAFTKYIQAQSETYWRNKHVNTITIPDVMMVCNVPYDISHIDEDTFKVDYESRTLFINKRPGEANNMRFCTALLEIICFHEDLRVAKAAQKALGHKFYDTLKMNNSFREVVAQKRPSRVKEQCVTSSESSSSGE
jgi:hypothetical protein